MSCGGEDFGVSVFVPCARARGCVCDARKHMDLGALPMAARSLWTLVGWDWGLFCVRLLVRVRVHACVRACV